MHGSGRLWTTVCVSQWLSALLHEVLLLVSVAQLYILQASLATAVSAASCTGR